MRRTVPILLALAVLGAGCGSLTQATVPLSYPLKVGGSLQGAGGGSFPGTGATVSQSLGNQGVSKSQVGKVDVTSITLTQTAPQCSQLVGCDLSFIDTLTVSVSAPGQPEVVVGTLKSPAAGTRKASLTLAGVDLAPYVTASSMTLKASLTNKQQPAQEVDMTLDARLLVHVKL